MSLRPSFETRRVTREDARERTFACDAPQDEEPENTRERH
jgi:hypothetical protein